MRYIATNDAWTRFQDGIMNVMFMCDERQYIGFMPWLLHFINTKYSTNISGYVSRERAFLHPSIYDLPIIFITERDFVYKQGVEAIEIPTSVPEIEIIIGLNKTKVNIPPESEFGYINNFDEEIGLIPIEHTNNTNSGRGVHKADWLGLYYPYISSHPRSIYIRIEKILSIPTLSHGIGVLSVVLHEIGHAIMDSSRYNFQNQHDEQFFYANDEAMANAFAYRVLQTRRLNKRDRIFNDIRTFMSSQPFVYQLGLQFATIKDIDDFNLKSYMTNLLKAKYTGLLENP